jgi:tripartite-type tricarboxylate transporter receptor subunit TctC
MQRLDNRPGSDWLRRGPIALVTLAAFAALASPVHANDYYAGKTITFIVGTDTGGGFSIYARAIAKHLPRYIPGNPMIVIRNMPGAGGAVASTWLYQVAPRDGTVIGSVSPNAILARLLGEGRAGYEPERFHYLVGAEQSTRLCVTFHRSRVRTLKDALSHDSIIGATTVGSPTREYAAIMRRTVGARFEIVSGYKGPADLFVAMERGEIDGVYGAVETILESRPQWIAEKRFNWLAQLNDVREGDFADVPLLEELAQAPLDKAAFRLLALARVPGKPLLLPPEVPAARVAALREAFAAMLQDDAFIADVARTTQKLAPRTWQDAERVIRETVDTPPDVVAHVREVLKAVN